MYHCDAVTEERIIKGAKKEQIKIKKDAVFKADNEI
jgi:hypothetical protein